MDNFDPYIDYEKLDRESARLIHKLALRGKKAQEVFTQATPDSPHFLKAAQAYLKSVGNHSNAISNLHHELWTVPVLVHTAGNKKEENNPNDEDQTGTLQRCSRCGSTLSLWFEGMVGVDGSGAHRLTEEEIPWWDVGAIVAKATDEGGPIMYEIDKDRELEKHERTCVSLNELIGDFGEESP